MLIKDLIHIDDHVAGGDFVLSLADGVERAEKTVADYVLTPQLVDCFDSALKLIRDAVDSVQTIGGTTTSSSKAAYLHGSFGSGKSHFMAVLDLLLANDPHARGIPELGAVVANHDKLLSGRSFALVPYHLIGAEDLESAIFGGYVRWAAKEHPGEPVPPLYAADSVLNNASDLRGKMGDDAFFGQLNPGSDQQSGGDKWGKMSGGWDAARYDAASTAPADDADRLSLVSTIVDTLLPAFKDLHGGFVEIDTGLRLMSQHAKSLGYDALILFLDELILWLAGRIKGDLEWAREEGSKLAKLVEAGDSNRPAPIVSFIARQRDLRELVGGVTGTEQMDFFDALQWWEGRFTTITLEDKNLPIVANRRLLQPKDEAARTQLDTALAEALNKYSAAADVLLGNDPDRREHARLVYPFSPTLVTTLVDVSSVLQRNRTALKVMKALLVSQRDTLEVGELIPVGELYDVIAQEDQPFSEAMQRQFDHARTLYRSRIMPQLMALNGLETDAEIADLPHDHAFHGQDRLVKTVVLAALVPETPGLRDLTAAKLEQLNAGSIETFIPGNERAQVIDLFRQLIARGIGEFEVHGDPENPRISIRLHGVDVESIVASAKIEDSMAARRAKVRDILAGAVGEQDLFSAHRHKLTWRGTNREIAIVFGNIRDRQELPDDRFVAGGQPKVVIDFPFDPDDHPPADDLARVEAMRAEQEDTLTICWLPSHLNGSTREQLGRLVVLDYLTTGDNFDRHASHLPADDRATAKRQIQSQAATLRAEMQQAFEEAYGIRPTGGESRFIDQPLSPSEQFRSLHHSLDAKVPATAGLGEALDDLGKQLMAVQFPGHPDFTRATRPADVARVWETVQRAAQQPNGRLEFVQGERNLRDLMLGIATPLGLGTTGENHFQLGDDWKNQMLAALAEARQDTDFVPTVGWMRKELDRPMARGLTREVSNLVILTVALQTDHTFSRSGEAATPDVRTLEDDMVLVKQVLPDQVAWQKAVTNAQHIFGWTGGDFLSADNLTKLATYCRRKATSLSDGARKLVPAINDAVSRTAANPDANRVQTAMAAAALMGVINTADDDHSVVQELSSFDVPTSAAAVGKSLSDAEAVAAAIGHANWALLESAFDRDDDDSLRIDLRNAIEADELAVDLAKALAQAEARATQLVTGDAKPVGETSTKTESVVASGQETLAGSELASFATELAEKIGEGQRVIVRWEITES